MSLHLSLKVSMDGAEEIVHSLRTLAACPSKGLEFNSQYSHDRSQLSVTPVLADSIPSPWTPWEIGKHIVQTYMQLKQPYPRVGDKIILLHFP